MQTRVAGDGPLTDSRGWGVGHVFLPAERSGLHSSVTATRRQMMVFNTFRSTTDYTAQPPVPGRRQIPHQEIQLRYDTILIDMDEGYMTFIN